VGDQELCSLITFYTEVVLVQCMLYSCSLLILFGAEDENKQIFQLIVTVCLIVRYFAQNFDWLETAIDEIEDDYLLFDCPGQFLSSVLA